MKIVLIRHGKPDIKKTGRVSASGFGAWLSDYDLAGIDVTLLPSKETVDHAGECGFVVCSDLIRSLESATLLKIFPHKVCAKFREFETPYALWKYPVLPIIVWIWLFRLLQLTGYSRHSESYVHAKLRSEACANQLIQLAKRHGSVVFVGHGLLNFFMHKYLLKKEWKGPQKFTKKYWSVGEYSYNEI